MRRRRSRASSARWGSSGADSLLALGLKQLIAKEHKDSKAFQDAYACFWALCKAAIDPQMKGETIYDMLVQHMLTERLFCTVFANPDFTRRNVIAVEIERVIDALTSREFDRHGFQRTLDRFYVAIEGAARSLTKRTGRGVDLIYQGLLRYGRPAPDYRRSNAQSVVVALSGGEADLGFLRIIVEEERRTQSPLPVDTMIALSLLWQERRIDTSLLARAIQRNEAAARNVLERLVEAGLVEAHGIKKGRTYTLSPHVYREAGEPAAYIRQAGFDAIQQEEMAVTIRTRAWKDHSERRG